MGIMILIYYGLREQFLYGTVPLVYLIVKLKEKTRCRESQWSFSV